MEQRPEKKHKVNPEAAPGLEAPGSAAAENATRGTQSTALPKVDSAAAAAYWMAAFENPEVMAFIEGKLEAKFVTKEACDLLEGRLDQIAEIFGPATKFALFETAIYCFVDPVIRDFESRPKGLAFSEDVIKHAMATLCVSVLSKLLAPADHKQDLCFVGLSTRRKSGKKTWSRTDSNTLVMQALKGLVEYLTIVDEQTMVDNMDTELRTLFTHNGVFLNALYSTPDGKKRGKVDDFSTTKAKVKKYQHELGEKAAATFKSVNENAEKFGDAVAKIVKDVVNALKKKNIIATGHITAEVEAGVVEQLNRKILKTVS